MTLLTTLLSGAGGGGGGSGSVSGIILTPVVAASVSALTVTYANGSSGVGATLTNAGAQAAISLDGISPTVGQRVLIKNQAAPAQNGVYTVTVVGTGATNWVLTRATDFDQASEMTAGSMVEVIGGTVNAGTVWTLTTTIVTVGTTSVTFTSINISTKVDQNGSPIYAADSVGTDSYAITLSPAPAAYTTGMIINFKAGTANTGACSLNVNSLGAVTIKKQNDQDTATGDIEAGQIVTVAYDGTNFQMQSQLAQANASTGRLTSFQVLTTGTAATYTKPAGITSILVECVGCGGAGGSVAVTTITLAAAGGGGGGGYCRKWIASAASTYTYSVGNGGSPGAAGNNPGSNGNASTFTDGASINLSAGGGTGGGGTGGVSAISWPSVGGAGGTSSGGDINFSGEAGMPGTVLTASGALGGQGGVSAYGGGGQARLQQASAANDGISATTNSGGGGGGAAGNAVNDNKSGGSGGTGLIVVWEFS